jgi:hypothetical protein
VQKGGVDNVISDICTFLHREIFHYNVISDICTFLHHEIFHVDGTFFDKTEILAEFPQQC